VCHLKETRDQSDVAVRHLELFEVKSTAMPKFVLRAKDWLSVERSKGKKRKVRAHSLLTRDLTYE
jgi:hypothetical protein